MGFTTKISGVFKGIRGSTLRDAVRCGTAVLALVMAIRCLGATNFLAQAQRDYRHALDGWHKDSGSSTAALTVARRAFEFSEMVSRDEDRADIARNGIDAARAVIAREPTNSAAYYWLGMDLGELARTKSLGAIPMVKEMTQAFLRAREIDEKTDHGGPDRSLGLLYRDAPGWPTSVGSSSKAKQHLLRAAEISPDFPENQLCLLESYEKWGERSNFDRQLKVTESTLQAARSRFTGPEWEASWDDWDKRWQKMKGKAAGVGRSRTPKGAR